jgi:hypothetical protein
MKKTVPLAITFVVGIVMIVSAFVPHPPFNRLGDDFSIFFDILAAFAFVLGGGNLLKIHLNKVSKRKTGWGYSAVTVFGFAVMLIAGIFKIGGPPGVMHALEADGTWLKSLYEYGFKPLSATMFSLLAFYVASASYRAFRAKNPEATALLIAAFIILLGRTLFGTVLTEALPGCVELTFGGLTGWLAWRNYRAKNWGVAAPMAVVSAFLVGRTIYAYFADDVAFVTIPKLVNWIMIVPQQAGQRAIMIGICLGVISMSLRLILGVERSHLGSDGE